MSRGVRDLRDLICVSRLTFHEDEEDEIFSDEDRIISRLSLESSKSVVTSSSRNTPVVSPDSGCITETSDINSVLPVQTQLDDSDVVSNDEVHFKSSKTGNAKLTNNHKKRRKKVEVSLQPARHELPKPSPLPPVKKSSESKINSHPPENLKKQTTKVKSRVNYDDILIFMDATMVANWLKRSNEAIQELAKFINSKENFVQFSHFWLSDFPDFQKKEIFSMEFDILLDEIGLAFAVGRDSNKVVRRDMLDLCGSVFKEYPVKLLGSSGPYLFLDYLDTLTSEKDDQYKKLLSDVRCSTSNRQYAQWLLATRSFALVNVWSSVVNFYRNLTGVAIQSKPLDVSKFKETSHKRMMQSIQLGYIDVISYLIKSGHVSMSYTDSQRKSLLFIAVMQNQPDVVKYFLSKEDSIDVNQPADNGNTALHAASNSGNLPIVEILCGCSRTNVNCINTQCDRSTPLHLAVMHGHEQIVTCLLRHGADPQLKMADKTATDLAVDFDQKEILKLLEDNGKQDSVT
ncbi:uncharacterized protein LOC131955031 [Physella acuta]|uniref:uncharacterized protein LOC131955031 n=1 Tax=Physella acuta TaxID=109671 RepID=UPI0027DBDBD3|nr:uncharacterized protein LOC131955031 [Physella acuta]XP_059174935.1 uncharacterized protein LOC131955031 [Physella acuta]XP_059174936.1 uncharacterized protein LOC131955031 [Physella acuta]XP_059174937.1 uncharacterized protein LOC131955031 [Physella acuta]